MIGHLLPVSEIQELPNGVYVKREDLIGVGDARGTKCRSVLDLAMGEERLVTAGGRHGTQGVVCAQVAAFLKIPFTFHCPASDEPDTPELKLIKQYEGQIARHRPGHRSVVNKRAEDDALETRAAFIPAWMECATTVRVVAASCGDVCAWPGSRLVVPVGSGMTLSGLLRALSHARRKLPVLGVLVGSDPTKRLAKWAPGNWRSMVELVKAPEAYATRVDSNYQGVPVDPIYSGKCVQFLKKDDLFWNSGARDV